MSPQGRNSQGPEPTVLVTSQSLAYLRECGEQSYDWRLQENPGISSTPRLVTCAVCEAGSVPQVIPNPALAPTSSPCSSSKHAHTPCCTLPHLPGMSTFPALLLLPAHEGQGALELRAAVVHTLWWTLILMLQLHRMR